MALNISSDLVPQVINDYNAFVFHRRTLRMHYSFLT